MAKKRFQLFIYVCCLIMSGLFFVTGVNAQAVSGTVFNDSLWLNDETVVPSHWYVAPTNNVVNGQGQVVVALIDVTVPDFPLRLDTQVLEPADPALLVDLSTVQGTN